MIMGLTNVSLTIFQGSYGVFSVSDSGMGMEEFCSSIPFFNPSNFPPLFPVGLLLLQKRDKLCSHYVSEIPLW
jgi:hypothetical protein